MDADARPHCPCAWQCHETPFACSFSCIGHHAAVCAHPIQARQFWLATTASDDGVTDEHVETCAACGTRVVAYSKPPVR